MAGANDDCWPAELVRADNGGGPAEVTGAGTGGRPRRGESIAGNVSNPSEVAAAMLAVVRPGKVSGAVVMVMVASQ